MVGILVAAAIDTSTTVVANTNTIQIALATNKRGQDGANGSNSKGLDAHYSSSGGTGETAGATIGGNEENNVISGGWRGNNCQIYR